MSAEKIEKNVVGIYLSDEAAEMPTCAYKGDVGYDLYAIEEVEIPPGCFGTVRTGVHLSLPCNMFAQVNTRSSHGKNGVYVHHGVIDSGYTGEITLWVMNLAASQDRNKVIRKASHIIQKGDKVAQLLFHKAERPTLKEIHKLPQTERGDKGYGSSGK